jgi:hypothetical protein
MTGNNVLAIRVPNKQQRLWNTKKFHKNKSLYSSEPADAVVLYSQRNHLKHGQFFAETDGSYDVTNPTMPML